MEWPYLLAFSILHFVVFITALLTSVAITILEGKFDIGCGLYIVVDNSAHTYNTSSPYSTCKYVTYMPVAVLLTSLALSLYHLHPTLMLVIKREPRYTVWPRMCLITTIILGIFVFIGSCIITTGFSKTCTSMRNRSKEYNALSCRILFSAWEREKGAIYSILNLAEASSWVTFLCLLWCISLSSYFIFLKGRFQNAPPTSSQSRSATTKY